MAICCKKSVEFSKVLGPCESYDTFFSLPELVFLRRLGERKSLTPAEEEACLAQPNMRKFYFNASVLLGNEAQVRKMLAGDYINLEADGLILDCDPITYAMKYNQEEMSTLLIEHCTRNSIYSRLYYRCGGFIMRDFLANFFEESDEDHGLPQYGDVADNVIVIHSPSPFGFEIKSAKLDIDIASRDTDHIRFVRPKRPIEITFGCRDIEELLISLDENMDQELLDSEASLVVLYLKSKRGWFFVIEGLVRILLLSLCLASIYIQQPWGYITALALLFPLAWYEFMTMYSSLLEHFMVPENILDTLVLALILTNSAVSLARGQDVMLAHIAMTLIYLRIIFALRFIEPIRMLLQIMVNIVLEILPFFSILIIFTVFAVLDGYLIVNPDASSFRA